MVQHQHLFNPGSHVTFTASADVVGQQLVYVSGNRQVAPTTASTAAGIGTAAHDAKAGEKVAVLMGGVQKVKASAAITAGSLVIPAAGGKVAALAAGDASHVVGKALTGAGAADVLVEIKFTV